MLAAVAEMPIGDDVFGEDRTTSNFESHVANITGRQAGMFVVTGTMANQLCLHALVTTRPCGILTDVESHSINFEGGGPSILSGGMVQPVRPSNGLYLRVQDLERHAIVDNHDVHKCPTGIISLENTAGGIILPLSELRLISSWARRHGVKTHLDGARLFEAVAAGAGSLKDYCELVDLVCLDFSKNLGAPMGAMVLGDFNLIRSMRRTRKAIGGGMRQGAVITAAAQEALFENFGRGPDIEVATLSDVHIVARLIGEQWVQRGGRLLKPVETNIVWLNVHDLGMDKRMLAERGKEFGVVLDSYRIVCHHQIDARAVADLLILFDDLLGTRTNSSMSVKGSLLESSPEVRGGLSFWDDVL